MKKIIINLTLCENKLISIRSQNFVDHFRKKIKIKDFLKCIFKKN